MRDTAFLGLRVKEYTMPCFSSVQTRRLPSFFVRSFFLLLALLFVQNVSLS